MELDASPYRVAVASVHRAADVLRRRSGGPAAVGDRLDAVLAGRASPDALTPDEHAAWLEAFDMAVSEPTPQERAFFAERRRLGVGVGLDEAGRLIREADRLYNVDFEAWTQAQAAALWRAAASHPAVFADVDVPRVVEELESLGRHAVRQVYERLVDLFETKMLLHASDGVAVDLNAETVDAPVTPLRRRLWRERAAALETDVTTWAQDMAALTTPDRFAKLIERAWRDARRLAQACPITPVAARVPETTSATCPDGVRKRLEARVRTRDDRFEAPGADRPERGQASNRTLRDPTGGPGG